MPVRLASSLARVAHVAHVVTLLGGPLRPSHRLRSHGSAAPSGAIPPHRSHRCGIYLVGCRAACRHGPSWCPPSQAEPSLGSPTESKVQATCAGSALRPLQVNDGPAL